MTETTQFTVTAEQFAGLTPAGQQQLESALTKAGASPDYIAGLKGSNKPGAPAKPATEQLVQPFTTSGKPAGDAGFNPPPTAAGNEPYAAKVAAFKALLDGGQVSVAQLQEAAKAEGVSWDAITREATAAPAPNMTPADANAKLAATSGPFAAGTDPNDYSFHFEQRHLDGLDENSVAGIHSMFRDGFFEGAIPLSLGQAVAREAVTAANQYDDLNEDQAKLRYAEEGAKLRRLGNIRQIVENHEYAWAQLPEWFREAAMESRMFHTADSFLALSRAGEMMRLRDQRAGGKK